MELFINLNDFLWSYILLFALVACALYFSFRSKFVQLSLLPDMLRTLFEKEKGAEIGPFQAFAIALSSRVGTGNLAGVASAIFVGGPGAVFWMWIMAVFGAATAFVESTLAQLYKRKGEDSYYGGPAYYMKYGLHSRWLGILFAVLITLDFGMANQVVQSTTLCDSISDTFAVSKFGTGLVITAATLLIVFGGIKRISRFTSIIVPFMAVGFVLISFYVIFSNLNILPHTFKLIINGAFGIDAVAGGTLGTVILQGVKRGLFSNEAGEGSAPNAAAVAETSHPVKQGLIQALGVFIDTLVICSCTAFIIVLSGKYNCGKDGILLTAEALNAVIGVYGRYFITAAIFCFAFSTIIANYYYGETNIRFITQQKESLKDNRWVLNTFRIITGITIVVGSLVTLQTAFVFVDIAMAFMTMTNLYAIFKLSPKVFFLLEHYRNEKKVNRKPVFHRTDMPEAEKDIECWE